MNDSEKLQLADRAIAHVLGRICASPDVGWYMGHATQSFEGCVEAYAAIHGRTVDDVREEFAPIAPKDPRAELQKQNEELLDRLEGQAIATGCGIEDVPTYGPQNLTAEDFREAVQLLLANHSHDAERFRAAVAELFDVTEVPIHLLKI